MIDEVTGDISPEDAQKFQVVDDLWLGASYSGLENFVVELDPNPIDFGPGRLIEKIHLVRKYQNAVRNMDLQASRDLSRVRRFKSVLEATYNAQRDHLLSTDINIRVQKSASDRVAMVNAKVPRLIGALEDLKIQEQQLVGFLAVVKTTTSNLRDTDRQIKSQISLVGQEISLGAQWMSGGTIDPVTKEVAGNMSFDLDFDALEEAVREVERSPKEEFVAEIDRVLST
jgi:hypothetical protein